MAALEKLLGGKEGKVQSGAFIGIDRAAAQHMIDTGLEAAPIGGRHSLARFGQPVVDRRGEAGLMARHPLAGMRQKLLDRRRPLLRSSPPARRRPTSARPPSPRRPVRSNSSASRTSAMK